MLQLLYLDPRALEADPDGIRAEPGDVAGLAQTIAQQGLLQPLGVVPLPQGRYQVVYGNRRRAAALHLGLEKVPCMLLDPDDPHLLLRQLTENVQRADLNDMEQARAFARLRAQFAADNSDMSAADLDERTGATVGLAGRTVRRYLGLLDLPDDIQQMVRRGELNVTQAQHLRRISNRRTQLELAQAAVDEGMSAAELSRLAGYFVANPNLTLETALQALEAGQELRERATEAQPAGGPLPKGGGAVLEPAEREDYWDEDEAASEDDGAYLDAAETTIENQPANKARTFRIRSLDQMVDETDRLSRVYDEGELTKWLQKDDNPSFKLRLLLRQLERLTRGLRQIADERGWHPDD